MDSSLRKAIRVLTVAVAALSLAVGAAAQTAQTTQKVAGVAKITTTQLRGEVSYLQGNDLVAKMIPSGEYRLFYLRPGKTATIDGKVMPLNKVPIGTVLTAFVYVTETPLVDRTVMTLEGTVWHVPAPNTVILTLAGGENRQYEVPPGMRFNVEGQLREASALRPGMKISATKIVETQRTEVREDNVVTGVTPKK